MEKEDVKEREREKGGGLARFRESLTSSPLLPLLYFLEGGDDALDPF